MRTLVALLAASAALILAAPAAAKGPSRATVSGRGLAKPLVFGGGENSGTPIMNLAEAAGFFPAAFGGQSPNPMLPRRPRAALGPRYTIRYSVPSGNGTDLILQYAYPYARRAVTYMPAGQKLFGQTTAGGWFPAGTTLRALLVKAGLPKTRP
jgi:hypothetical protein